MTRRAVAAGSRSNVQTGSSDGARRAVMDFDRANSRSPSSPWMRPNPEARTPRRWSARSPRRRRGRGSPPAPGRTSPPVPRSSPRGRRPGSWAARTAAAPRRPAQRGPAAVGQPVSDVPADGVELPRHGVELSIGIDDQRVLAAALGHERGKGLSAGGHHLLGGGGGVDERNLVRARAARRGASVTKPVDELQHRLLRNHLGKPVDQSLADAWRVFAGLEDHGVAGGQRVGRH
jgi:hypothetical protein